MGAEDPSVLLLALEPLVAGDELPDRPTDQFRAVGSFPGRAAPRPPSQLVDSREAGFVNSNGNSLHIIIMIARWDGTQSNGPHATRGAGAVASAGLVDR